MFDAGEPGPRMHEGNTGVTETKNPHWGTRLEDFLASEGLWESARADAMARVTAWQSSQAATHENVARPPSTER